MEDKNRVLDQEYEYQQDDTKRNYESSEETNVANENLDADSNYEYNSEYTQMVAIDHGKDVPLNSSDFNMA